MKPEPSSHEVLILAQKLMKCAGTQDPVVLVHALLLCIQTISAINKPLEDQK